MSRNQNNLDLKKRGGAKREKVSGDKRLLSKELPFPWEEGAMDGQEQCSVEHSQPDPHSFLWGRKKGLRRLKILRAKSLFLCFIIVCVSFYLSGVFF